MTSFFTSAGTTLQNVPEATQKAQGLSLRTFIASLSTSACISTVELCIFMCLKDRLKHL